MYFVALAVMLAGSGLVVVDTLIRQHIHEHQHTYTHTHDGTTHTHIVKHSHEHNHYVTNQKHIHHHSEKKLKRLSDAMHTTEQADEFIEGIEGVRTKTMFLTTKKKNQNAY